MEDSAQRLDGPAATQETCAIDDANLPPGRLMAPERRSSGSSHSSNFPMFDSGSAPPSPASLHIPPTLNSTLRRKLRVDGPRSRSMSPSLTNGERTPTTLDANSSFSSLDELQDILTDRAGLSELDPSKEKMHNSKEYFNIMPPVTERMSEETLDDCHAFSDVRSYSSRNSAKGVDGNDMSTGLEPLNECDESDDDLEDEDDDIDDDDNDKGGDGVATKTHPQIILTNLDNLNFRQGIPEEEEP